MKNSKCFIFSLMVISFVTAPLAYSQKFPVEVFPPGLREQAIVMDIAVRVVDENNKIVWNSEESKITIPGQPVGVKVVGSNIGMELQFTPYLRSGGEKVLTAQGQIWISTPGNGIVRSAVMETIPLNFEEEILFFPLGSADSKNEALIEIQLVLYPYSQEASGAGSGENSR
ncbi:MAG: hypothetical protein LBH43_15970 [Treponema sp.]|jgi:hypothetical protein|nr:hypothetical protein [Treponema sp.]